VRIELILNGTTPLVTHNIRLADDRDPLVKQIKTLTARPANRKTEAESLEIERLEWEGGLYYIDGIGYCVPTWGIIRTLEQAAKATREGTKVNRALSTEEQYTPIEFPDSHLPPEKLWLKEQYRWRTMVTVNNSRIARTRPCWPVDKSGKQYWRLTAKLELEPTVLDFSGLQAIAERAGRIEGTFDARKLGYGRFTAELRQLESDENTDE
jgi:hypothetical protein